MFANVLHRQTFMLVFLAALLPSVIVTIALYYLIFGITSTEAGFPEMIAYTILPAARRVTWILLITAPLTIFIILLFAHNITHRIIGPFDRIVDELDSRITDKKTGPISVRRTDKFKILVEKINKLLEKIKLPVD